MKHYNNSLQALRHLNQIHGFGEVTSTIVPYKTGCFTVEIVKQDCKPKNYKARIVYKSQFSPWGKQTIHMHGHQLTFSIV